MSIPNSDSGISGSSAPRFNSQRSETHSNTTDFSNQNDHSIDTLDRTPIARASVAISDKLWSQIDVLDDVKAMAAEVDRTGGFFTEEFSSSLAQLKMSQSRLLDVVSRHQAQSDKMREQRHESSRQESEVVDVDAEGINNYQERTRRRMNEFFSGAAKPTLESAQLRDFDELNAYVSEVKENLAEVSDKMTDFDRVTKKLW